MINISSYILYNLSNLLIIILIPSNIANEYLNVYSIGSGVFSFYVFYHFSIKELIKKNAIIFIGAFSIIIDYIFLSSISFLVFIYTFLLIYSDYYFSQSSLKKINFSFKFLLLLTSLILILNVQILEVIYIKLILICSFLLFSNFFEVKIINLKVNSPIKYSLFTCFIYFGSLFLISILANNSIIKIFYISMQIVLGFKLKIFDLDIRSLSLTKIDVNKGFNVISFLFFLSLSFYYDEVLMLIIFVLSFLSLDYVKKKFIN